MSFCQKCGKQLPEGVTVCECENGVQAQNVTPEAPATVTPVTAPAPQFVAPMVNNAPVGSAPVTAPVSNGDNDEEYLNAVKDCKIINILGIILFLAGIVSVLFINEWVAAIIFFIAELFVLVPNTKVQKLCKAKNPTADKKAQQTIVKETTKRLKSRDKNFKFSFIIAIVCLISLVVSFIVPVPLIREEKRDSDGMSYVYEPEESTTEVAEPTEAPTTESEVFVPNGPYRPTFDEFLEAYLNGAKECLTLDLSNVYNVVHNGNTVSIGLNAGSMDYMTISCTLVDDRIESIYVNFSTAVFAINSPGSNSDNITMCKMMSLFVPYVAASFQTSNIKMQFDNFWDFVVQVDNMANQNYIYSKSIEMEGCVFSVFATSTFDFFECEVTLPQV